MIKMISRICKFCGKEFQIPLTKAQRGNGKFCSLSCNAKYLHNTYDFYGSNNPNWRGGIKNDYKAKYKRRKETFPERIRASSIAKEAVKKGRIIKPDICQICGQKYINPRHIHGHHQDYSKPLDVIWLCCKCHVKLHNGKLSLGSE